MRRLQTVIITFLALFLLTLFPSTSYGQGGQGGSANSTLINGLGRPLAGVNVAICQPLATTAAAVSSATDVATFTMASNPITAGFKAGMTIEVAGFSGADIYFNAGALVSGTITGGYTILSVTTTVINVALTHATASASSNGTVLQEGNSTTPCAGIATIYTDNTLGTTTTNPFVSDGMGNWNYWGKPGLYYYQFYGPTVTTTLRMTSLACVPSASVGSCGATLSGNNTWTGQNIFNGTVSITTPLQVASMQATPACPNETSATSATNCGASMASVLAFGGNPPYTISTTAVTSLSAILITPDQSAGATLGITCDTATAALRIPYVTSRVAGASFSVTFTAGPAGGDYACFDYLLIN